MNNNLFGIFVNESLRMDEEQVANQLMAALSQVNRDNIDSIRQMSNEMLWKTFLSAMFEHATKVVGGLVATGILDANGGFDMLSRFVDLLPHD